MRLLSAGHFVADAGSLPPGTYRVTVGSGGGAKASTTFTMRLKGKRHP
jgi:hypothetical protein